MDTCYLSGGQGKGLIEAYLVWNLSTLICHIFHHFQKIVSYYQTGFVMKPYVYKYDHCWFASPKVECLKADMIYKLSPIFEKVQ